MVIIFLKLAHLKGLALSLSVLNVLIVYTSLHFLGNEGVKVVDTAVLKQFLVLLPLVLPAMPPCMVWHLAV